MASILSVFVSLENDGAEACRRSFLRATAQLDIIELPSLVVDDYFRQNFHRLESLAHIRHWTLPGWPFLLREQQTRSIC